MPVLFRILLIIGLAAALAAGLRYALGKKNASKTVGRAKKTKTAPSAASVPGRVRRALPYCLLFVGTLALFWFNSTLQAPPLPLWAPLALGAAGFALMHGCACLKSDGDQRALFAQAAQRLEKKLENGTLPLSFTHPVRQLMELGRGMAAAPFRHTRARQNLAARYNCLTDDMVRLGKHFGARKKRLLTDELNSLTIALYTALKGHAPTPRELVQDALKEHARSAAELWRKARAMPKGVQDHILAICDATDSIISCLNRGKECAPGVNRFLVRYLKAAHLVLDRHARLLEQGPRHKNIAKVLDRSKAVLANLERIFQREHARLLHSDADDFSAELKTLDTLMRMDGAPPGESARQEPPAE